MENSLSVLEIIPFTSKGISLQFTHFTCFLALALGIFSHGLFQFKILVGKQPKSNTHGTFLSLVSQCYNIGIL